MNAWVKKEIELACSGDTDPYIKSIFNSAAKAYMSLSEDGHSGMSIGSTMNVLKRLVANKPLTPLTGHLEEWSTDTTESDEACKARGYKLYQNIRCSSVFKREYLDGRVEYSDVDRFVCIDLLKDYSFYSGDVVKRVAKLFPPIEFPYTPLNVPYKIYVEDFLVNPDNGDFDCRGIYYVTTPEGETVRVDIYQTEVDGVFVDITKDEYMKLRDKRIT